MLDILSKIYAESVVFQFTYGIKLRRPWTHNNRWKCEKDFYERSSKHREVANDVDIYISKFHEISSYWFNFEKQRRMKVTQQSAKWRERRYRHSWQHLKDPGLTDTTSKVRLNYHSGAIPDSLWPKVQSNGDFMGTSWILATSSNGQ